MLPPADRRIAVMGWDLDTRNGLKWDWRFWARPEQCAPPDYDAAGRAWTTWLILAGRGYGKTKTGSETTRSLVYPPGSTPLSGGKVGRIALIAETAADARDVMVQGPSGILAVHPPEFRPIYKKSQRSLEWPNGAIALLFSAEEPDQLRGPEHDWAWGDEIAKWKYAQDTYDMLQFGMRIGERPRQMFTTTPRPIPIVRELLAGQATGDTFVTRGSTFDNAGNLASPFMRKMKERYSGTRLGRQELNAELLDDVPGALWTRAMLDRRTGSNPKGAIMGPAERVPEMQRIVIGVDPSGTSGEEDDNGDDVGIVVVGKGVDGASYVLEDATSSLGPSGWGRQVIRAYEYHEADLVVGERNYGGAMVEYVIRTVKRNVNYENVTATRGKVVRAEPIASLYEQGRVRHVGSLSALEDQMCGMTKGGYLGKGSPDRVDALVWALTELEFGRKGGGGAVAIKGHS